MFVRLPDAKRDVSVYVLHTPLTPGVSAKQQTRVTVVEIADPEKLVSFSGASVCNPNDNFCKHTGRLNAAKRLNVALSYAYSDNDRYTLLEQILPKDKVREMSEFKLTKRRKRL